MKLRWNRPGELIDPKRGVIAIICGDWRNDPSPKPLHRVLATRQATYRTFAEAKRAAEKAVRAR